MDELVRWFGAQLDTDEAAAEVCLPLHLRVGRFRGAEVTRWRITKSGTGIIDEDGGTLRAQQIFPAEADHVVRHDPARVLREIDADRRLLARYSEVAANDVDDVEYAHGWANALGLAVRLRASAFSDRPGYREEWAP